MTTLSAQQEKAVKTVVGRIKGVLTPEPVTTLEGFAGTGKSTILPFILEALGFLPEKVTFCAPTGKAAKVMRQKLMAQKYPNPMATTIHSAIYRAKPAPIAQLETDLEEHERAYEEASMICRAEGGDPAKSSTCVKMHKLCLRLREELNSAYREDKINFQLNPDSPIQHSDLIVVDEASMVGARMAADLMEFGVPILAMGDPGQLPPVEDKPGLLVGKPDFFLSEVHRQAQDNPIIHLATLARQGENLPLGDYGQGVEVMNRRDYDPILDRDALPKFLVGTNKTRWRINQMLREEFGVVDRAGERVGPQAGEPLIVCKNNREHPDLVNGTECVATSSAELMKGDATFLLSFEDESGLEYREKKVFQGLFEEHFSRKPGGFSAPERTAFRAKKSSINMDWAYAITVHKSQGSQWDDVVVIDESGVFRADADKHLYTALTRAAKTLKVLI